MIPLFISSLFVNCTLSVKAKSSFSVVLPYKRIVLFVKFYCKLNNCRFSF